MNTNAEWARLPTQRERPGLHAGFWMRVAAYLLDALILSFVLLALYLAVAWRSGWLGAVPPWRLLAWWWIAALLIVWLYYALCEASPLQATPGKLALGVAVTDAYGRPIGFGRATGRFFGKFLSGALCDVGYLLAGWTPRKQALHDLLAGCCVVRRDALAAVRNAPPVAAPAPVAAPSGMPGWAIGLLVVVLGVFVVLPGLGIVAAIAIPAYQGYTVRAEVEQGVALTQRARALVAEYIDVRGALPDSNAVLGLPAPQAIHAEYVSSVRVRGGQVVITYGNAADARIHGGHVVLSPSGSAARLQWRCSSPDIRNLYLPASCR